MAAAAPAETAVGRHEEKDEAYFSYYAMLTHQAQMLQDSVRTSAYQSAILSHGPKHFSDKTVMDVGAGNGILSLFALQAGASLVYAVEASEVVGCLHRLVRAASSTDEPALNPWIQDRLAVVHGVAADTKVDTIVSECLGVLLVHERMCESFLDARDQFLRPGGAMFPATGTLCFSLLSDARLWQETKSKGEWWNTDNFYGVDLRPFLDVSRAEAFSSPVVGCFSPSHIVGAQMDASGVSVLCPDEAVCRYLVDFCTISSERLREFDVPIALDTVQEPVVVHGLGGWFDLSFLQPGEDEEDGTNTQTMTTSPFAPPTHWAQVRLLFQEPLALNTGQVVLGSLHFKANDNRSYDIHADLYVPLPEGASSEVPLFRRTALWKLDKQTYSWETQGA